jgi:hypothetical protein
MAELLSPAAPVVAILAVSVVAAASALVPPAASVVEVVEESVLLHAFSAMRPAPSRGRSKRFIIGGSEGELSASFTLIYSEMFDYERLVFCRKLIIKAH